MNWSPRYSWLSAAALVLLFSQTAGAHRLDEYLQATRISVDRDRIHIEIDLTAGLEVAEKVFRLIDTDRDGEISSAEGAAYAKLALGAMALEVDGRNRPLILSGSQFPSFSEMSQGVGTVRLQATATIAPVSPGDHRLVYANTHQPDIGVYLINALVPQDKRIEIAGQERDTLQHEFKMDYRIVTPETSWLWAASVWLIVGLGFAAPSCLALIATLFRT